jgi:hypothetical protein
MKKLTDDITSNRKIGEALNHAIFTLDYLIEGIKRKSGRRKIRKRDRIAQAH